MFQFNVSGPRETAISTGLYERWCVHSQAIIFGQEDPLDVINPIVVANSLERGSFHGNSINYDRYNHKINYAL